MTKYPPLWKNCFAVFHQLFLKTTTKMKTNARAEFFFVSTCIRAVWFLYPKPFSLSWIPDPGTKCRNLNMLAPALFPRTVCRQDRRCSLCKHLPFFHEATAAFSQLVAFHVCCKRSARKINSRRIKRIFFPLWNSHPLVMKWAYFHGLCIITRSATSRQRRSYPSAPPWVTEWTHPPMVRLGTSAKCNLSLSLDVCERVSSSDLGENPFPTEYTLSSFLNWNHKFMRIIYNFLNHRNILVVLWSFSILCSVL